MSIFTPVVYHEDLLNDDELPAHIEETNSTDPPEWNPDIEIWLRDNLNTYERYLLHAAFHDHRIRVMLLDLPIAPDDFWLEEHSLVMSSIIHASKVHPNLPYPPAPEDLESFLTAAASREASDDEMIAEATELLKSLSSPDLSTQHYLVRACFRPWVSSRRAKKAGRSINMEKLADVVPFVDELDTTMIRLDEVLDGENHRMFDYENPVEEPDPILLLNGFPICTAGNISNIQGPSKSGKSSIISAIMASAIKADGQDVDSLGFSVQQSEGHNSEPGTLLHFDTEQSQYHRDRLVRLAYRRAGLKKEALQLESHLLTGLDPNSCWRHFSRAVKNAARRNGGINLIIIDGIADFCTDPNDAEACFELIRKLHSIAMRHKCAVLTVLHENPGSSTGKTRGHLGSQLERKVETALRISKDTRSGRHVVWADKARSFSMPKSAGQNFAWSEEFKMHASLKGDAPSDHDTSKQDKYSKEVIEAFGSDNSLPYKELCARVMKCAKVVQSTAKARVRKYLLAELVEKHQNLYRRAPIIPQ